MVKGERCLAIILARGGSKRVPRKNILNLCGKPLVAWSIEAAQKSKYIDTVVVSSDDDEILEIAKSFGAIPLHRPEIFSNDTATSFDAVTHVLEHIKGYTYTILLQPTSPLRNENHITDAIELLKEKEADAVVSVCEVDHSPLWSNTLPDNRSMKHFLGDEVKNRRSQDLEIYYRLNGAIYICQTKKLLEEKSFFLKDNIYAYVMDRESSIDIDEEIDFKIASLFMEERI